MLETDSRSLLGLGIAWYSQLWFGRQLIAISVSSIVEILLAQSFISSHVVTCALLEVPHLY